MQIIKNSNIDFINNSKFTILLSSALILASIFSLVINKGPELSIDFKGGTLIAVNYTKPVNINDLRSKLKTVNMDGKNFDFSSAEIKHFGNESSVALRIANIENEPENFSGKLIEVLKNSFPDGYPKNKNDFILSIGKVSPKVGSELSGKAIMAIIYAITLILIYISLRFEFVFAIGAIAAIAHDVTITLGIFSILGYEISLPVVAAFLTIVGYSLNDTIVINGNGLDEDVLNEANLDEVETVLALTNDDEDNLMVSVLVEKFSKNKRTMALVNKPNYSLLQSSLKIDDLIDPRMSTVSSILKHVHKGTIENAYTILNGEYEVIEADILETSELVNKELKTADLPDEIRVGAILRNNNFMLPSSKYIFQKDDTVILLAKRDQLPLVENLFRISSI